MRIQVAPGMRYGASLLLATLVSCCLLVVDAALYHVNIPWYMAWNLFLAWVPFLLALGLLRYIRKHAWSEWLPMLLTVVWLAFLPNSFYMVSDFIHLAEITDPSQLLFSAVMFTAFIVTGVALGVSSLYLVHRALKKRLSPYASAVLVAATILVCSIAIYIGRDLRWNTWDLLVDPAGMLFDMSMRLTHPSNYAAILEVVTPFFVLLGTLYAMAWQASKLLQGRR
ncbi:MAG: DUF1361 domain-containing protein [Candidatus Micrarchaeaceae archaeon]